MPDSQLAVPSPTARGIQSTPAAPAMAGPMFEHKVGTALSEKGVVVWKECGLNSWLEVVRRNSSFFLAI